jgi:hypothetical protein
MSSSSTPDSMLASEVPVSDYIDVLLSIEYFEIL